MAGKKGTSKTSKAQEHVQEQKANMVGIEAKIDRLIEREGSNLKAVASATIGGAFAVHGIRISDSQ